MTTQQIDSLDQLAKAAADALRRGDPGTAQTLFERVTAERSADQSAWFGLALACRRLEDDSGQLNALEALLALDPGHVQALMMKADYFARTGDGRAAQAFYKSVVTLASAGPELPPELRAEVLRAKRECARYSLSYEGHLRSVLSNAGYDSKRSSPRFGRCLDLLLGKQQIYLQSPTAFYFPELPQRQFYERREFAWLPALERNTDIIRVELEGVLRDAGDSFLPYVQSDANRPRRDYGALLDNPDWSAFYLIRNGEVSTAAAARCPRTLEALVDAPLTDAPGRTPSVLFSLLRPKTRIPAHTGYTNARLICHLPLVVPSGCGLRVGSEIRHWTLGEAMIFDDSMEHEAWNDSDEARVVLLFDVWRPELTQEERKLVAATLAAVGSYDGKFAAWT